MTFLIKISLFILLLTVQFKAFSTIDKRVLYCQFCDKAALATALAGGRKAHYLIIDIAAANVAEIKVKQKKSFSRSSPHELTTAVILEESAKYLQGMGKVILNLQQLNNELIRFSQVPINLPGDFPFVSVVQALSNRHYELGFSSSFSHFLNTNYLTGYLREMNRQVTIFNALAPIEWRGISLSLTEVYRESYWATIGIRWQAVFSDNTSLRTKIAFEDGIEGAEAEVEVNYSSAKNADGTPIPYTPAQVNDFRYDGDAEGTQAMIDYFQSRGVPIEIPKLPSLQCKLKGMTCSNDSCKVKYSCGN